MALPISILIVDDEPEVAELLASILETDGHACTPFRSGVEALQAMRCAHQSFDLLITDHHMPGSLGGLDLVRVARAKGFRRQVVVMSGHLTDEIKAGYRVFSVLGFLPKPFDMKLLRAFAHGTSLVPSPFREGRAREPGHPTRPRQHADSKRLRGKDGPDSSARRRPQRILPSLERVSPRRRESGSSQR